MKAMVYHEYGTPDLLELEEVEKPVPKDNEVLIKVHAASVNASDCEFLKGSPSYVRMWGLFKPKYTILGSDIAGTIESSGRGVTRFQPGDCVYGDIMGNWGGFAQYVCAPEDKLLPKPPGIGFEEAAALPQAASIALQGLRDKGNIQPGMKVLINGAGGGWGTFAIQLAGIFGATVTGVDNAGKLDLMRDLGAESVIDYTTEDFTEKGDRYDLILDFTASHSIFDYNRALSPDGKYVMVGGTVPHIFQTLILGSLISIAGRKSLGMLAAEQNKDLGYIIELIEAGKIKPVIDKRYPLNEVPEALRYLGEGRARGKIIITV